jgi:hypothetical protein
VNRDLAGLVEPLVVVIADVSGADGNAVARATEDGRTIIKAVLAGAGEGHHHITVVTRFGSATVVADVGGDTARLDTDHPALLAWLHLGATQETGTGAGITLRSITDSGAEVQAWLLAADGEIQPQSEAEVFAAYCTDAGTGEPVAPEHAVRYCDAFPLGA